jgi:hypothetical protein
MYFTVNGRIQAFQPLNAFAIYIVPHACRHAFTLSLNFSLYIHLKSKVNNETGGKIIVNSMKVCLTSPIPSSRMFFALSLGPVAQLGARLNRTEEVRGSNPLRSTGQCTVSSFQ